MPYAESAIRVARQNAATTGRDDAANLLERLVRVELSEGLSHAREPAGKITPVRFAARGGAKRFDEIAVREKNASGPVCSKPCA